ncbi:epidermal growth factor receptor substrate 15-like isoform X2 [Penaeus japonicus]|uniref:epidermal growth factor receptor substrate 15-like isoform X2 n=1 Tax=Penaeus japonicus TaxID=27405 RepID=UPI001C7145D6|nr:epidermal growth factor receptor substrate 15-like isoform X2 [Penaeus japonicus]
MLERKFISFVFLSTYDTSSILIQKQREREISVKNSETVNLQKETRDLKEDLRKKEEEIVLLKDMQEEQGRERSRMETEVTNLHAENSEMKDILCLKEREIRELKDRLEEGARKIRELRAEVREMEEQLTQAEVTFPLEVKRKYKYTGIEVTPGQREMQDVDAISTTMKRDR